VRSVELVVQKKSVDGYATYLPGWDQWVIKKAHGLGQ